MTAARTGRRRAQDALPPGRPLVVVVGSVNVDLVVRVRSLPGSGETVTGGVFSRHHGGKGANQAVAAARMGAEVRFVGAVGDDELGDTARTALIREGIDVSGLQVMPGVPTGVALIVVDSAGENQIAVASGANAALGAAWVARALNGLAPRPGAMLLTLEIGDEPLTEAARRAVEAGLRVVLAPAPARPVTPGLLAARPILVPNLGEAQALSGVEGAQEAGQALAGQTGAPVVVTLGREGALIVEGGRSVQVPGSAVRAVDATGAGDTVVGVVGAELAAGRPLDQAVRVAMAAAALSTTVPGAREGMPDRSAVEALMAPPERAIRADRRPRG
jgi:ribokinase